MTIFRKAGWNIEAELEDTIRAVENEKAINASGGYKECFKGTARRRTLIVIGTNFFLQATGQAFVSLYGTVIISSIGGIKTFDYTLISTGIGVLGYFLVLAFVDRFGRRVIMISGVVVQAISMFIIAGVGSVSGKADPWVKDQVPS